MYSYKYTHTGISVNLVRFFWISKGWSITNESVLNIPAWVCVFLGFFVVVFCVE